VRDRSVDCAGDDLHQLGQRHALALPVGHRHACQQRGIDLVAPGNPQADGHRVLLAGDAGPTHFLTIDQATQRDRYFGHAQPGQRGLFPVHRQAVLGHVLGL